MKILIHGSDPWRGSGMSIVSDEMARGLAEAGHEVHMFASQVTGPARDFPPDHDDPDEVYTLHGQPNPASPGFQMFSVHVQAIEPDLVVTNRNWQSLDWMPNTMNDLYMNYTQDTSLLMYGPPIEAEDKPPMFKEAILEDHLNDVVMVPFTENRYENMLDWDVDDYLIPAGFDYPWVPHGVDHDVFYPGCSEDHRGDDAPGLRDAFSLGDRFVGLFVGENWRRKNIDTLLFAWRKFRDHVIQEGSDRPILLLHTDPGGSRSDDQFYSGWNITKTAIGAGLNVASDVTQIDGDCDVVCTKRFTGQHHPPELVASLMDTSDVYLLPTSGEGFSMTSLEAMATGTPIIQTGVETLRWLCRDASEYIGWDGRHAINTGEQMVNPSASSLTHELTKLHDNPERRSALSRNGIERAADFPWSRMREELTEVAEYAVGTKTVA